MKSGGCYLRVKANMAKYFWGWSDASAGWPWNPDRTDHRLKGIPKFGKCWVCRVVFGLSAAMKANYIQVALGEPAAEISFLQVEISEML